MIQPYNRREEVVEITDKVPKISAKHESGDIDVEKQREHPSDILEYFLTKKDMIAQGLMGHLEQNYLDKHDAVNRTVEALTKAGIGMICASNLN